MRGQVKILFVCTGNICRSPMAEAMFRHKVKNRGLADRMMADSAGTHGYHIGARADPRTLQTLRKKGVDETGLTARSLSGDDYTRFDVLVAMNRTHQSYMKGMMPMGLERPIPLMMDFASGADWPSDVPDPYYGAGDGFNHVYRMLDDATDGLIEAYKN